MNENRYREVEQRLWAASGVTPTERFVRLPRARVQVRIQEVGEEGPPVLFIHGGPNSGSTWAPLVARLRGLRCLVLDRPGTGLSDPFDWHQHDLRTVFETHVVDVLDALELPSAHLVASSSGSDFAILAGALHPDRVLRSVHMSCPGFAPGIQVPFFMCLLFQPGLWRLAARMPATEKGMISVMRQMGHGATLDAGQLPPVLVEWCIALYRYTHTMRCEAQAASLMLDLKGIRSSLLFTPEELAAVQSPSFFLWGEHDNYGDATVGHRLVEAMPNAELEVLPGGGHLPWLDDPERAAEVTRAHLLDEAAEVVRHTA
jgi:2-hydroxy-6-oxonona-2,4-dienedioate hydrolase